MEHELSTQKGFGGLPVTTQLKRVLHRLLANHCALCEVATADYLCPDCARDLPRLGDACPMCALPLVHEDAWCADCLEQPKPFELSLCPFVYRYPIAGLVNRFKQQRQFAAGVYLAQTLADILALAYEHYPDALVPMPLHWHKRLIRGFSQAHFIAALLSQKTGIPLLTAVKKRRATAPQKGLTRNQRLQNLDRVFEVVADVQGRHLVIIDDVMTTCASVMSVSTALLNAGAARVDVAVLARTPKH